jgi:uncharacterized protein YhfF
MTKDALWEEFIKTENIADCEYDAWAFGTDADLLADLVLSGKKTATASAFPLYETEGEPIPNEGEYSVILNSRGEAVCIIKNTRVTVVPFSDITPEHAYREGEGDRSLKFWREVHEKFFTECMKDAGLEFTEDMKVVCEEFEVVYKR